VVASWERFKGGQRLEFRCGGRALAGYGVLRDAMAASVRLLSVLPAELPGAIERLQADARDQKRTVSGLQSDLARYQAEELAAAAEDVPLKSAPAGGPRQCRLVARVIDTDASGLKNLATAIVSKPGFVVALVSAATPALIVIARSADIEVSAQLLLTKIIAEFGGRGGGQSQLAQAGGLEATSESILAFVHEWL
jgi:alanyl-tRNA synthetase